MRLRELSREAEELKGYMSDLSEKAYSAEWYLGLEYALWNAVVSGPCQFGRLFLDPGHIRRLRELSERCGGWIVFEDGDDETWVPLGEWTELFAQHSKRASLT